MKISHSALSTYLECPYKYFLHYFRKLRPTEEKSSLAFGDAVDVGLNHLLETRNLEEALLKYQERWNTWENKKLKYSKADYEDHLLNEDELGLSDLKRNWISMARKGQILIQEFNEQVMPRIKEVVEVQINRTVQNDLGDDLVIKTDFICIWEDGTRILFDNKTSSVKYPDDSVRTSPQLGIYYEQLKSEYKLDKAGYIVIPKKINKKKLPRVSITVIIDSIDEATTDSTLAQYDEVLAKVKAAQFLQNKKSCIGKYGPCPYFHYCKSGSKVGLKE